MITESLSGDEKAKATYITIDLKSTAGVYGSGKYKKPLAIIGEGIPRSGLILREPFWRSGLRTALSFQQIELPL